MDATRIQYSSHTNELVGFVLPLNDSNGMPVPHVYKTRSANEIVQHFSSELPIANYVITVMAQTLQNAAPFFLCVYGTDNHYTAQDISKQWNLLIATQKITLQCAKILVLAKIQNVYL